MSFAAVSTTSRQSSKPHGTGEGGNVFTAIPEVERRLRILRSCGRLDVESVIDPRAPHDEVVGYWRDLWEDINA